MGAYSTRAPPLRSQFAQEDRPEVVANQANFFCKIKNKEIQRKFLNITMKISLNNGKLTSCTLEVFSCFVVCSSPL